MTSPDAGDVLAARYRLEERLGTGATASVWRARDVQLDRLVAVKVLTGTGVAPELAGRFAREGVILARLSHQNLVRVLDSGEDEGTPFLVMDLVDGKTLRQLLADGPLRTEEAIGIVADVAAGLAVAHAAGVIHRDATPANIVLDQRGVPTLVDFGIARSADLTTMTSADLVMGTAAYFAPEQAQGHEVSPATDVYALGCVLMEAITGSPPFDADSSVALAYRHVHDPAPTLRDRDPDAQLPITTVVSACLAKDPLERYADAGELEADLRRVQRGEPVLGPAPRAAVLADLSGASTVAIAPVAAGDGTMVLPAVVAAAASVGEEAAPAATGLAASWSRRRLLAAAGGLLVALLLLAAVAAGRGGGSGSTTTTTIATTTTTVAPTTTAPPPPEVVPGSKGRAKHGEGD